MRAVDTNVLVRLISHDDEKQLATAEAFIEGGAWASVLALAETVWLLETVYGRSTSQIGGAIEALLHHEHLTLQDAEAVRAALASFKARPAVGFSDCLMLELARKAGHLPMGTFDARLGRLDGAQKL